MQPEYTLAFKAHHEREFSRDKAYNIKSSTMHKFTTPESPGIEARTAPFRKSIKVDGKSANASLRIKNEGLNMLQVNICNDLSGSSNSKFYQSDVKYLGGFEKEAKLVQQLSCSSEVGYVPQGIFKSNSPIQKSNPEQRSIIKRSIKNSVDTVSTGSLGARSAAPRRIDEPPVIQDLNQINLSVSSYSSGGGFDDERPGLSPSPQQSLEDKENSFEQEVRKSALMEAEIEKRVSQNSVLRPPSPVASNRMARTPRSNPKKNDMTGQSQSAVTASIIEN